MSLNDYIYHQIAKVLLELEDALNKESTAEEVLTCLKGEVLSDEECSHIKDQIKSLEEVQ